MESSSCITNTLSPVADLALTPMSSNANNKVCMRRRVQHRGTRIVFLAMAQVVIFAKKQRGLKIEPYLTLKRYPPHLTDLICDLVSDELVENIFTVLSFTFWPKLIGGLNFFLRFHPT